MKRCHLECSMNVKTESKIKLMFVFFWTSNNNRKEVSLSLSPVKKDVCMTIVEENYVTSQSNGIIQAIC